jgi:transcriptional regulator with XRE-family HTH domain
MVLPTLLPTYAKFRKVPCMARKANGAAIKALREALGITQQTLAERAGVTREAISQVETGKWGMRPGNLRALALGLGVSLDAVSSREPTEAELEEYIASRLPGQEAAAR